MKKAICFLLLLASASTAAEERQNSLTITYLVKGGFQIVAAHEFKGTRIIYLQKKREAFQCILEGDLDEIKEWFKSDTSICTPFTPLISVIE